MWLFRLIRQSLINRQRRNASMVVAIIGIFIGVMSLIIVVGVMNGLQQELIGDLIAIESYEYTTVFSEKLNNTEIKKQREIISSIEEVTTAVAFVDEFALMRTNGKSALLQVRAIGETSQNDEVFLSALQTFTENKFVLDGNIVLGLFFAIENNIQIGDVVSLTMPGEGVGFSPVQMDLVVSDVFSSQSKYDVNWAFISLENYVTKIPRGEISNISVGVRTNSQDAATTLKKIFPNTESWKDAHLSFYVALKTEKITLSLLIAIIFGIIVLHFRFSIIRRINNKKDDIVSLRAMGATPRDVKLWFLGEGLVISFLGIVLGVVGGFGFIYYYSDILYLLQRVGLREDDIGNLKVSFVSVRETATILLFVVTLLFLTVWGSIKKVAKIVPLEIIRNE